MKLNLTKPIVFFDLETTGLNIGTDKIVEICMLKVLQDNSTITKTERINPKMHIPEETSKLHGIYDKDVVDKPVFAELAPSIRDFIKGCDLAGYNLLKFDIPLLVEEFLRIDMDINLRNVRIIDVQNIFHRMEPRNLRAAYKFYCGEELVNAHSAEADTVATFKILEAQLSRYENTVILDENDKEYIPVKNDIATLSAFSTNSKNADFAGHLIYDKENKIIFNFGKHKGIAVEQVFTKEPSYYDWMMKADFPLYTKKIIHAIRIQMLNDKLL
ncbi:MAG: ribonuclease H-like domain-containing protein [Bacteroidales bacterium]|jgi:DNA polymerase-3 subunit epsilon|nr:ribonuclease H-like domain-containing protein [Bacteroidales bacterium]